MKYFVSCNNGMQLLQGPPYQRSVKAVVIDEAHCIFRMVSGVKNTNNSFNLCVMTYHSSQVALNTNCYFIQIL